MRPPLTPAKLNASANGDKTLAPSAQCVDKRYRMMIVIPLRTTTTRLRSDESLME